MNNWTLGAYDLHIHTAPDIINRKCSDIETARRIYKVGMKGFVIKSHYFETASRAALLQEQFPQLKIAGSLTLNRSVGGINPNAVLRFGQLGGKMLWFPTMDALAFQAYKHKHEPDADLSSFLTVYDENGELSAETLNVLKLAAHYNMTVGVGHVSSEEGLKLVQAGRKLGVSHMVITHAEHPALGYSEEKQIKAVQMGAWIEHSYNNIWFKRASLDEIYRQICAAGYEHVILSSDLGQPDAPYCDEGMEAFAAALHQKGIPSEKLRQMMCSNPEQLIF